MKIGAGDLNKRISILAVTLVDDGYQSTETFASIGSTWAKVSELTDVERFRAGAIQRQSTIRFIIRKRPITTSHRITYKTATFFIEAIREIDDEFIELTCGGIDGN